MVVHAWCAVFFTLLVAVVAFFSSSSITYAQSQAQDGVGVFLDVTTCNNNGLCEAPTESWPYCPLDCSDPTATTSTSTPPGPGTTTDAVIAPYTGGGFIGPYPTDVIPQGSLFLSYGTVPAHTSAVIVWVTRLPTIGVVRYGETSELEGGVVGEIAYNATHHITLTDLKPDTYYYVRIVVRTIDGMFETSPFMRFKTLRDGDNILLEQLGQQLDSGERVVNTDLGIVLRRDDTYGPPTTIVDIDNEFSDAQLLSQEVRFFYARRDAVGDVALTWLPPQGEYRYVRIVRRADRFSKDARDGDVVYEGRGDTTRDVYDTKAFGYYAIFVRKSDGSYSQGMYMRVGPVPIVVRINLAERALSSYRAICEDEATRIRSDAVLTDMKIRLSYYLGMDYCSARLAPWYWYDDFRPTTIYYWIRCVLWKSLGISW